MIIFAASTITVLLAILCVLCNISSHLNKLHTTIDWMEQNFIKGWMVLPARNQQTKKKRIYWRDDNGQRRWRKND